MDELRKNHIVQITTKEGGKIDGIVFDYSIDRVLVLINPESVSLAKNIKELDELSVCVNTHLGIKKMQSAVISELNSNCITIENSPSIPVVQKREFVRVLSSVGFKIITDINTYSAVCINISAGGVAFYCNEYNFNIGENVKIILPQTEFEKEIEINATIIKSSNLSQVAKFENLNSFDEDKIVKYVFKMITKN